MSYKQSLALVFAALLGAAYVAPAIAGVPTGDRNGCQLVQRTTDGYVCLDL